MELEEYRKLFVNHEGATSHQRGGVLYEVATRGLELVEMLEKIKHAVHNVQRSARDTVEEIKGLLI